MTSPDDLDMESLLRESELYNNPFTEKQKNILDAAEQLFGERGFSDTSTAEIARKAGVTEKTLFKHFPKKADLLRRIVFAIAVKTLLPLQFKIMQNLTGRDFVSFEEMFSTLVRDRLETMKLHGPKLKVLLDEMMFNVKFREEFITLFKATILKNGRELFSRLQERGLMRKDVSVEVLLGTTMSVVCGVVFSTGIFGATWIESEKTIDEIAKLLAPGFKVQTA